MDTGDIKNYSKILCEIIMKKDRELCDNIRKLTLSAVSNRVALSKNLMEIIKNKLIEWEIDVQSFDTVTSEENALVTLEYLIETFQSDEFYENENLKTIKKMLMGKIPTVDDLYNSVEMISSLIFDFKSRVNVYNVNSERRINVYKHLKDFASDLYSILCIVKQHLNNFTDMEVDSIVEELTGYMKELLESSIVITDFPSRTIKKGTLSKIGTHFKLTVKCLIESEKLFFREELRPFFLSEGDFKDYIQDTELKDDCEIKYTSHNSKSNVWELKNMLWSPSERQIKDRRKSDRITNQKAIIMINFRACANPYLFGQFEVNVRLFTDTVVSIVHTNQEIDALITLFWDDYFRIDRTDFLQTGTYRCKDSVVVKELVDVISRYFEKETCRGLTLSNKEFLYRKLSQNTNGFISFSQFANQVMPDSNISFGNWILLIIKLLKIAGVFELWKGEFIDGFMNKNVESLMSNCSPGTFILRFSEKNAKVGVLVKTPYNVVEAWNPFSADECRNRNLCECLMDFHELQFIRSANGDIVKKVDVLAPFICSKHLDDGYTERGQLSRMLCSDIYLDTLTNFDDIDDMMDTSELLGITVDIE